MTQGSLSQALCNNLEQGMVWEVEGGFQEGGDICIPMTDSCCYMAETNTIL